MHDIPQYIEYISVNRNKLHLCIRTLDFTNPVILFLAGTGHHTGDGAASYGPLLDQLAREGFTVAGLDVRGHGKSSGRRGDFTMEWVVDDLDAVLDFMATKCPNSPIGILGSSQGGLFALYAAAKGNPLIKTICCHNAMVCHRDGVSVSRAPRFFKLMAPFLRMGAALMPTLKLPTSSYLDVRTVFRDSETQQAYLDDPLIVKNYSLRSINSLSCARPARPISEISIPTMIITGEKDSLFSVDLMKKVYGELSEPKRLEVIPGALHLLPIEYVDESLPPIVLWFEETLHSKNLTD